MDDTILLQIILGLMAGGFLIGSVAMAIGCKMLASVARDVNRIMGKLGMP